jgi:uncharacterized protein (DUF1330 family)
VGGGGGGAGTSWTMPGEYPAPVPPCGPVGPVPHNGAMSAYWISTYREILDEAKVAAYAELAGPALREAGGTFVARGLPEQTYEAGESTRTVVIRFGSVEEARAAHDAPAYQEALAALDGGAVRDMRIVPGVE